LRGNGTTRDGYNNTYRNEKRYKVNDDNLVERYILEKSLEKPSGVHVYVCVRGEKVEKREYGYLHPVLILYYILFLIYILSNTKKRKGGKQREERDERDRKGRERKEREREGREEKLNEDRERKVRKIERERERCPCVCF
jgi:hypothetical protein